jgi:hypothetical protein
MNTFTVFAFTATSRIKRQLNGNAKHARTDFSALNVPSRIIILAMRLSLWYFKNHCCFI